MRLFRFEAKHLLAASMALALLAGAGTTRPNAEESASRGAADIAGSQFHTGWQNGIVITVDKAKVIRIDGEADTVIIGNPSIADATLYDRRTLVITGRAFGSTNILILDDAGQLIVDETLQVQAAVDSVVTVQRRGQSYTYSCTPLCRPSMVAGDDTDYFENTMKQSKSRVEFASESAAAK